MVIVGAAILSKRSGVATPLIVLAVGVIVGLIPAIPEFSLEPEWVLAGVLPPLLYASSVRIPVIDLRRNLASITWLSIVLVLVSALVVGVFVHWFIPQVPLAAGVAFGAIVSPTDAVAATAIGKKAGLPNRIMVVLESESLFNDATALVLLRTAIAALATSFSFGEAVWEFASSVVIAVAVGVAVGLVTVWWRGNLNDPVLNTVVSFIVPFVAYVPAELLEASGVVAVVVAGVVTGHQGAWRFSARERAAERINWATIQFLIENGLFLAMGLELHTLVADLPGHGTWTQVATLVLGALVILFALRVVFVAIQVTIIGHQRQRVAQRRSKLDEVETNSDQEPKGFISKQRRELAQRRVAQGRADLDFEEREPITRRGGVALVWAEMRGVLTLAAALTLPSDTPYRTLLITAAFGVAIMSLAIFGTTLRPVISWAHVPPDDPAVEQEELTQLMLALTEAGEARVTADDFTLDGLAPSEQTKSAACNDYRWLSEARFERILASRLTSKQQLRGVKRAYLLAMSEELRSQQDIGNYSSAVLRRAQQLVDAEEIRLGS